MKRVEHNFEGICPDCKEWTTAGDSCCGRGAWVEGGLVSDESAQEALENPTVCIELLKDAPHEKAAALKTALWNAGISVTMFGHGNSDKWNINIFLPAPKEEK